MVTQDEAKGSGDKGSAKGKKGKVEGEDEKGKGKAGRLELRGHALERGDSR